MTKSEYLQLKKAGSIQVVYEYYKERFDRNKHKPFLPPNEPVIFADPVYGNGSTPPIT